MQVLQRLRFSGLKQSFSSQKVVLFPGDGIGPEISQAVVDIFSAAKVPIEWEHHVIHKKRVTQQGDLITEDTMKAVREKKYALKGPFETPIGKGYRSLNVTLRKRLQLYANVRPCISIKGVNTPYQNVNVVTIRENTEGEYSGLEHEVVSGVVENLKIVSYNACKNIAEYAFEYARANCKNIKFMTKKIERKQVVACHKAGVMKMGDGLFLKVCDEVAKNYPDINYQEEQIDTMCFKLANDPQKIDMMVMPNLYGDIVSDLCAGLIGGLGLTASGNIGKDCEVYEAVHGTAPDIEGKNLANPTALLLSGIMMLKSMKYHDFANRIEKATYAVLEEGKWVTGDLGGKAKTTEYTKAIIDKL